MVLPAVVVRVAEGYLLPLRVSYNFFLVLFPEYNLFYIILFPNKAHVETVGVKRPGFGSGGRAIDISVNAFPVTVTDGIIYHYDSTSQV